MGRLYNKLGSFSMSRKAKKFLKTMNIRRVKLIEHALQHNILLGKIIEGSTEGKYRLCSLPLKYKSQVV